jgi:cleavage and polyadenylation specificity factor subunit 1
VLVFGANTLIYMNQSSSSLGFSLNCLTDTTTNFQLRQPTHSLAISMDCSQAAFVSNEQLVVALRGGEIYVLTLVPDGLRGLKNILFEKAAAGVIPSCVSRHSFLGELLRVKEAY